MCQPPHSPTVLGFTKRQTGGDGEAQKLHHRPWGPKGPRPQCGCPRRLAGRHAPDTIWSKLDLASGCLSRDFGVKMISWKGNTHPAASGPCPHSPSLPLHRSALWVDRRAGGTHGLAEGQQDLPAQHVEVAGRRGAVHHNPVAVVELAHLEVLGEDLPGRAVGVATTTHEWAALQPGGGGVPCLGSWPATLTG